jgi:hypothetical protein
MKLYIDSYHYNPNKLKIHLLKNKFKHDKFMSVEFYTNNGIYTIENNEMYKLVPMDNPIELVTIHGLDFIIDKSYYTKKPYYQLSPEHIIIKKNHYVFGNSKVTLVVEGDVTTNEDDFVPTNFYFDTHSNNSIDDPMILNEFNEFLSTFN